MVLSAFIRIFAIDKLKNSDMLYKVHKATTKKGAERRKLRHSVHVRTSKALSRVRRRLLFHYRRPLCITISTEGLTQEHRIEKS